MAHVPQDGQGLPSPGKTVTPRSARDLDLDNRSGYETRGLRSLLERGLRAAGLKKHVKITATRHPSLTRGCAVVGGRDMVLSLPPPSKFRLRRAARIVEHEAAHLRGLEHEDMSDSLLWSKGKVPAWAKGIRLAWSKTHKKTSA